jgi:hypothetical protein
MKTPPHSYYCNRSRAVTHTPHTTASFPVDTSAPITTNISELPTLPRGPILQVPSLSAAGIVPNPPPQKSPVGTKAKTTIPKPLSEDPFLSQLFMHRLFQGASTADPEVALEGGNSAVEVERDPGSGTGTVPLLSRSEDLDLAFKYPVVEYSDNVEPRDRVRWAQVLSSNGDSLSASSLPSAPSSSSARSFVRVRVTGGWMKAKVQSSIPPPIHNGYGPSPATTALTENLIEQRVRKRAALDSTLQPSERGLGSRYRRKLLEAVANSAFSTAHKKKTQGSEGRQSAGYHNQSMDAPLLFYLPCEGRLSAACVTCAPKPLSLSALCADNEMCAFCLNTFEPGMKLLSPAYIAGMQRRRDKDKKSRAAKRRKLSGDSYTAESDFETDTFKSPKYLVSKTVGTVSYALHQQCAFAVDNGGLAGIAALALKAKLSRHLDAEQEHTPHDRASNGSSPTPAACQSNLNLDKVFKGIDLGDFYECDETDDAECDLCGRAGGIMQFFDLDSNFSSLPPPGEEGWLGHVPCISWLVSSKLLELPPSYLCRRGFLMGESPVANFSDMSYSPLKHYEKDFDTDSPAAGNRSRTSASDMRVEEAEGSKDPEMRDDANSEEATATSPQNSTINDVHKEETVVEATESNCGQTSSNTVESSTSSTCLNQTVSDGVSVSEALNEEPLLSPELTIKMDESTEGGDISCAKMHDTSLDCTISAITISLKREAPDACDAQMHEINHKDETSEVSPNPKRHKISSTTQNEVNSEEKPLNDCINYWSVGNHVQDRPNGSVSFTLIQDKNECLSLDHESTDLPTVFSGNVDVLPVQPGLLSAALPDPSTASTRTRNPPLSIETSFASCDRQEVNTLDSAEPHSPSGQTRDTPRKQPSHSESDRVGSSSRRVHSNVSPLSLFDSLVGQWRCSCCGTFAGVVLKCSAVACTVRAHPLCVSIAGSKWTSFEATSSSSQTALGFLCALHSPQGIEK